MFLKYFENFILLDVNDCGCSLKIFLELKRT